MKLHPSQPDRTAQTKEEEMQNKKQSEKEEEKLCQIREMTPWERVQVSRKKIARLDLTTSGSCLMILWNCMETVFLEMTRRLSAGLHSSVGNQSRSSHRKRTTTKEILRGIWNAVTGGVSKALRLMEQAEISSSGSLLVDTTGAICGLEAEERGQGEAIARNIYEMSCAQVPILSVIIGEGGSGGALALATADEVWMLENSIYSILSPEGFASILWKDSKRAKEAAEVMRLTAKDLYEAGIVEQVFAEPEAFTSETFAPVTEKLREHIRRFLKTYQGMEESERTERRYQRFRRL